VKIDKNLYLSIDFGMSYFKYLLMSKDGKIILENFDFIYNNHSIEKWKCSIERVFKILEDQYRNNIIAIGISGMGPVLVGILKNKQEIIIPLKNSNKSFYLPSILEFKQNDPELYDKIESFLPFPEYMNYYLTDEKLAILLNTRANYYIWDDPSIEECNLDKDKFPAFIKAGEIIAPIKKEIKRKLNIKHDIQVVSCGLDFYSAIIGTGAIKDGDVCYRSGTSIGINYCSNKKVQIKNTLIQDHLYNDHYNISKIYKNNALFDHFIKDFKIQLTHFIGIIPFKNKVLPILKVKDSNIIDFKDVLDKMYDMKFKYSKEDIVQIIYISLFFNIRSFFLELESNDLKINNIILSGGYSLFENLNQFRSNILDKPVQVTNIKNAELIGNIIFISHALGEIKDYNEGIEKFVKIKKIYYPEKKNRTFYFELFKNI